MSKFKTKALKIVSKIINTVSQSQQGDRVSGGEITSGMPELLRRAAAEGAVLLKNDGTLPLDSESVLSVFGRVQKDYFYTGYGSGGDVIRPYQISLIEGLKNCKEIKINEELASVYEKWCAENPADDGFWGHWPRCYPEMPIDEAFVKRAAEKSDCAAVVIGRSNGEDRENVLEKGSFYLSDEETRLLERVTEFFEKTIVIFNIGCIMDFSALEKFGGKISAALIVWQGGMESGNAVADLLSGKVNPCGCLPDTVAKQYVSYPSASNFGNKEFNNYEEDIYVGYRWFSTFTPQDVLYPFGFGLSYTDFEISTKDVKETDEGFEIKITVTNTGKRAGKKVVQIYAEKPCGVLGNPYRELASFLKTDLLAPSECATFAVKIPYERFTSYDSEGKSGYRSAYVLQTGEYGIAAGGNVRDAVRVYSFKRERTTLYRQLNEVSAPKYPFDIIRAEYKNGKYKPVKEPVAISTTNLRDIIVSRLPSAVPVTEDKGYKLSDVKRGVVTMKEFIAQLNLNELEALSRGDYVMDSPLGAKGNAGTFGGVLESLRQKGIPAAVTTDGPSGIRLKTGCSLIPIGTLLASTFDTKLIEDVYEKIGEEMLERGSDVLLAPGMNIHRNPLCGRNFEYFSEDPYLTGIIAAAAVNGIQRIGVSACVKHFACNNQEFNRLHNDSRLSERALREIYLKGFEICVKTAKPKNLMTSYNKINGVWGHYNYELCTLILREEWGYRGNVMTDWWMRSSKSPEFPRMRDNAYRVRSQVDVLMPGGKPISSKKPDGTLLKTYGEADGITLGELQRSAENVLNFLMNSSAYLRLEADGQKDLK